VARGVIVFAPAKVNLYLHLLGQRVDGYHLLDSLIAFADIGDEVAAVPAGPLSLTVGGPEAAALTDLGDDNLVLRAAHRLVADQRIDRGAALHLDKRLPVSSGIGGGSSNAAAALRALIALWNCPIDEARAMTIAAELGADVPACLAARPVRAGGIGEQLEPIAALPPFGIVLTNPNLPLPTAAVFGARRGPFTKSDPPIIDGQDSNGLIAVLASCRNDLTEAALSIVPEIGAALHRLAALPGALLARMSGSGATCFALFADRDAARGAKAVLARAEPGWWSCAGALLTSPPQVRWAEMSAADAWVRR
jgi:4-diphosphocytidyl-2-C-methyl-D-erythritol kinase